VIQALGRVDCYEGIMLPAYKSQNIIQASTSEPNWAQILIYGGIGHLS
jgi:hypothetical protein